MKRPKLPTITKRPLRRVRRAQATEERVEEAIQSVPRITNETVAEHREEVLGSARKYIYPLQHSKHRVVKISLLLFVVVVITFFAYCGLQLYRFQSTSGFMYGVTRVIAFPVGKADGRWISYESYLFELRHNMHYYQTQQRATFKGSDGKTQLHRLKQLAMQQVIQDAYIKQLASEKHVSVSNREVDDAVTLVRNQNRLGSNDRVFQNVLQEFWGWRVTDFKRELRQQLLTQKVVAKLDSGTESRAQDALKQLQAGADFTTLAKQVSEDPASKQNGGDFGQLVDQANRDVAPQVTAELFKLKPGQISGLINTGYTLEIVKVLDVQGTKVHAAHISFAFKDVSTYVNPIAAKHKPHEYIKV